LEQSGSAVADHIQLPTNKIIQFLHHCLPSAMLTTSHWASSYPYYRPTGWWSSYSHY